MTAEIHVAEALEALAALEAENADRQAQIDAQARHISDLEKSLENARKERDTSEASHEALLVDVAKTLGQRDGEDTLDACARVARERDEAVATRETYAKESGEFQKMYADAHAELARLKSSGQVAEDEARLRHTLNARGAAPQTHDALSRLAAKAQGYEGAVADNAALLDLWRERGCLDLGPTVQSTAPGSCLEQGWPLTRNGACPACRAMGTPHPGAAMLERHRKEVAQARDDGLEEAAQAEDAHAITWERMGDMDEAKDCRARAANIRAMKTSPTCSDGSCATCRSGEPCH